MNRVLKFRARTKYAVIEQWVYGFYSQDATGSGYITSEDGVDTWEVRPETVGQYTGLTDKNSKDIYECDVVRDTITGLHLEIRFGFCERYAFNGWYAFAPSISHTTTINGDYGESRNSNLEVIGNIYENPELLTPQP